MVHLLLAYRRVDGNLLFQQEFSDVQRDSAWAMRHALVLKYLADPDVEVVLLSASSVDEIMLTHSRYFRTVAEVTSERPAVPGAK